MAFLTGRCASAAWPKLLLGAAALSGLAVANTLAARAAERRHPPRGRFLTVDGVRLHYRDEGPDHNGDGFQESNGRGRPVVLIHGNAVTGDDWRTSGVA